MPKLGNQKTPWKIQRQLMVELPGLGKPGALERRPYPPGQHGLSKRKFSEYGLRLREKQKIMFHYGLREEQLRRLVVKAKSGKSGDWVNTLISFLETRLDNVVFRLGFAPSTAAARQLVRHGKVRVNDKRVNISSAAVNVGDVISLTDAAYHGTVYQYAIAAPRLMLPDWLTHQGAKGDHKQGTLRDKPGLDAVPFDFDARLVAEYYSKV